MSEFHPNLCAAEVDAIRKKLTSPAIKSRPSAPLTYLAANAPPNPFIDMAAFRLSGRPIFSTVTTPAITGRVAPASAAMTATNCLFTDPRQLVIQPATDENAV